MTAVKSNYREQSGGSTEGGTLLWIYGAGFAQNGFSTVPTTATTNVVKLVSGYSVYECIMQTEKVTNTQLTCNTVAMPGGVYQVQVYVYGILAPLCNSWNSWDVSFTLSQQNTPLITNISPISGLPKRFVTISGDFKSSCYSRDTDDCSQENKALISR